MKKHTTDLKLIKRILSYLKPYKSRFIIIILCLIATTMVGFLQPLIIRVITDDGLMNRNIHTVITAVIFLLLSVLAEQGIEMWQAGIFADIHNESAYSLFHQAFHKLLRLKKGFYENKNNAEIINTVNMDVQNVVLITDRYMAMMIGHAFKIISGIAGLLIINWKLTLIVLAIVPVKYFTVRKLARRNEKKIEEYIETSRDFSAWFGDLIGGIYEVKLWNLYHAKDKVFSVKQNKVLKTEKDTTLIGAWNRFIEVLLEWGAIGLQYIMGGLLMISGELTIGGVFAFLSYSSYVTGPISFVMNMRFFFSRIIPSAKRLFKLLDAEEEKSGNDTVPYQEAKLGNFVIDFENVSFTYAESAQRILNKINLSIEPGKKIAIIGANGSGKSTILNLLLRFTEPTGGKIKLCGKDIQTLNLAQYRAFFAVVSQEPYLFFDTIENNINLFGDADHAAINSAAKQSGAMGFIERLPEREKSMIGQNGAKLSGGEKQKLAVARAIIKDAPIIILDEATSGYDVESDKYLYRILEKELKNKTVIIITHRYDCLSEMDMVFKLEEGYLWRQFNNA